MPELPEVEVVKKSLRNKIQNLTIKKIKIKETKLRYVIRKKAISRAIGLSIKKVERRSKFILFYLDKAYVMLVHLGMTGKFFFVDHHNKKFKTSFYYSLDNKKDRKYDRVIFHLNKKKKLIYNDVRKFGFIKLVELKNLKKNLHLKFLGPEPLSKKYNSKYFRDYIKNRNRFVKDLLMDQKFLSGLGNIYVNEILFLSKVNPLRKVASLTSKEINKIINFTKKILKSSIKEGGSSIKDFSSSNGKKGIFQQYFNVYGKKGEYCSNSDCNNKIIRVMKSNRSTFYCSNCQK